MRQFLIAFFCLTAFCLGLSNSQEISDQCLGCLCSASTGCNRNQRCTEAGVCGPFLITWPYWSDAGKFALTGTNPNDNDAYSTCTNDLYCASETVRGYMRKYAKDCNGDNIINCEDFARIHKNGPGACSSPELLQTEYYRNFARCKAQTNPQ